MKFDNKNEYFWPISIQNVYFYIQRSYSLKDTALSFFQNFWVDAKLKLFHLKSMSPLTGIWLWDLHQQF